LELKKPVSVWRMASDRFFLVIAAAGCRKKNNYYIKLLL